jgi:predicted DNA-binding transcriptional regulator YafY
LRSSNTADCGSRMTANAALDRAKFAKVCALYLSTTYAGERQAAHRKMQLLAKAAGLTVEQAAGLAATARSGSMRSNEATKAAGRSSFGLVYRTAARETSKRTVDLLWISHGNGHPGYLRCYCHLRGEFRSFRIDRVISIYDPETGQVIADTPGSIGAWVQAVEERL